MLALLLQAYIVLTNMEDPLLAYGPYVFHEGERKIQTITGTRESQEEFGRAIVRDYMPEQHRLFYVSRGARPLIFASTLDDKGRPWASILIGQNLVSSPNPTHLEFHPSYIPGDPLQQNLSNGSYIGILGIEFTTRRRNRVNGKVQLLNNGDFALQVDQSYGNCPKYIQARTWSWTHGSNPAVPQKFSELTEKHKQWISSADTFFVASACPVQDDGNTSERAWGADVSHRGGNPGFVRVEDSVTVKWPDYLGNFMFNTLGNIELYKKCGLLFIDFNTGDTLQLTGEGEIFQDEKTAPGAQRTVHFKVSEIIEIQHAIPMQFDLIERSPYNPKTVVTNTTDKNQLNLGLDTLPMSCQDIQLENFNTKSYTFSAGLAIQHQPGQYATFEFDVMGAKYVRTWTISSCPESVNWDITITVKKKDKGIISNWIFDNMRMGNKVKLLGVSGTFTLAAAGDARKLLMIAGGVGITPIMSMVRYIAKNRLDYDVVLLHSVSLEKDRLFGEELKEIERIYNKVKVYTTVTREKGGDFNGRVDEKIMEKIAPDYMERVVYLCGPEPFMENVEETLNTMKFPMDKLHTEKFNF